MWHHSHQSGTTCRRGLRAHSTTPQPLLHLARLCIMEALNRNCSLLSRGTTLQGLELWHASRARRLGRTTPSSFELSVVVKCPDRCWIHKCSWHIDTRMHARGIFECHTHTHTHTHTVKSLSTFSILKIDMIFEIHFCTATLLVMVLGQCEKWSQQCSCYWMRNYDFITSPE